MGIKDRLIMAADHVDDKRIFKTQLKYAGETIEAVFDQLKKKLESIADETCRTLGSHDQRLKKLESQFQKLQDRTEALKIDKHSLDIRIKALEKKYDETLKAGLALEEKHNRLVELTSPELKTPQDSLPTDRHGKPEGGLEQGDVISYPYSVGNREYRMLGQFIRMRSGNKIWGGWKDCAGDDRLYPTCEYDVDQNDVTFEFRPNRS